MEFSKICCSPQSMHKTAAIKKNTTEQLRTCAVHITIALTAVFGHANSCPHSSRTGLACSCCHTLSLLVRVEAARLYCKGDTLCDVMNEILIPTNIYPG